ncbi:hypothetical protein JAAARDRAFT_199615 [Jaapia argillacea MUCL 33604]|uniref:Alpha/beta hydrolase fold-3 domain-containing protein n=1 Tax=Jaapia argillacea MUCL 33604 TaxID=933084 RepID=A0A067P7S2_9AGAM|nr:hypothetical protein JAAARDRAFT_199615 [Jaapia argillacea MUCL 33604]
MPVNTLTGQAGLKLGPVVLETLIKHYFDRLLKDDVKVNSDASSMTNLRRDELLYDEAFNIVKTFLEAATRHTVEELQGFSNTRTPSPPWVHVVRLVIPMSCCDEAAIHLIKALGGEEVAKRVVGGTKWWQVRGVKGVDAEWITAKKDWQEAKKRQSHQKSRSSDRNSSENPRSPDSSGDSNGKGSDNIPEPGVYNSEMDEMRCILYFHGGGYYFGSVDQERYALQRFARKINGRVFGINYRLAPQYPFPCAIQDALAAYLFLIRPPENSLHLAVSPSRIVLGGDSAGGGLTIALLQVIRDAGLPLPAGAILISPWCDMTHSFPSVHTNTATDIIPPYGLSFHKPSTLWPPPSEEATNHIHNRLRTRIRQAVGLDGDGKGQTRPDNTSRGAQVDHSKQASSSHPSNDAPTKHDHGHGKLHGATLKDNSGQTVDVGSVVSLPNLGSSDGQQISLRTAEGETLTIDQQVHLYAPNNLLNHPLVSSAVSYLGGLPPLFIIASDKEVLRDEVIYTAHRAAHPDKYTIKEETRKVYPMLEGIEDCYGPTQVHLQIYDDAAHVLPVLFSFTTPAKFCYRAIATFCKHVTGIQQTPSSPVDFGPMNLSPRIMSPIEPPDGGYARTFSLPRRSSNPAFSTPKRPVTSAGEFGTRDVSPPTATSKASLERTLSNRLARATSLLSSRRKSAQGPSIDAPITESPVSNGSSRQADVRQLRSEKGDSTSSDVGGPRFGQAHYATNGPSSRTAGDPTVYASAPGCSCWTDNMIRERVSTQGIIRPLEPESQLAALQISPNMIGVVSELSARRYLDGMSKFDKKFAHRRKSIAKSRRRNLDEAKKDTLRNMAKLQSYVNRGDGEVPSPKGKEKATKKGIQEGLMEASGSWTWAWALDGDENPPPSSIVSRRDTEEARRLAKIADQPVVPEEKAMSANNLWSLLVEFLTTSPDKHPPGHIQEKEAKPIRKEHLASTSRARASSRLARFFPYRRQHSPTETPGDSERS